MMSANKAVVSRVSLGSSARNARAVPAKAAHARAVRASASKAVVCQMKPSEQLSAAMEKVNDKTTALAASALLMAATAPAAMASDVPAYSTAPITSLEFWGSFWSWRTSDPATFALTFIAPFGVSIALIEGLLKLKRKNIKQRVKDLGFYEDFIALGVDTDKMYDMKQLNFVNMRMKKNALTPEAMRAFAIKVKESELAYFPQKAEKVAEEIKAIELKGDKAAEEKVSSE